MSDAVNIPAYRLKQGTMRPYDGKIAADAAHAAAHGILCDLNDRYGIKDEFRGLSQDVKEEVVSDFAAIIREAMAPGSEPPVLATAETLRDRFAMAHLTGRVANFGGAKGCESEYAVTAYIYADAMMEARGR